MATHFSTLAWKILWMKEPHRLQSMGLQRVGHDWATSLTCSLVTKDVKCQLTWDSSSANFKPWNGTNWFTERERKMEQMNKWLPWVETKWILTLLYSVVFLIVPEPNCIPDQLLFFYWSTVDLHCCVNFCCTSESFSYSHTHTNFF